MIPVAIFFLALIVLLLFKTKTKNSILYENIFGTTVFLYTASTLFYYLPFIITLSTTLINYGESAVSTLVLYRLIGFLLGVIFIILASLSIYKTLTKLSDMELKVTVIASLCIFGITQIVVILQRLYSLRIIPRNSFIFWLIATVVNNGNVFIFAVIVFIMAAPILLWKKNSKITETYNNNAELRKIKAKKRNAKRWSGFSLGLLLISIFSLSFLRFYVDREIPLSPPENYSIENGMAAISLGQLEDNKLHRYEYITEAGIHIRFIAIKKSENAYGVGLDACDICGPGGYFERNNEVICKLCDVVMNKATIGFPGGCNPVPIPYIVHAGNIKIKLSDLESEAHRFK